MRPKTVHNRQQIIARIGFCNCQILATFALYQIKKKCMKITNCLVSDSHNILSLYESARDLQTQRNMVVWPFFDKAFIEQEIHEQRQWKIVIDNEIACNWTITFEDKEIWGERDKNDSIFIHRICTNPNLRGNRFMDNIVEWAKEYAKQLGKQFVRLDTLGNNTKLIKHYTSSGFTFLGMFELTDTATLPKHYQDEPNCCLFEIEVT
jgi:GNAT superfamily N-acetyltransferase